MKTDLRRDIGVWGALAIMVGIIIGSGIFRTPVSIADELGNPWLILALWVVGGLISLCGALTYAELATMYPQSGGVYVFLREGFGRPTAFVFGWTYMLISKPMAAAGIAVIFGEHVNRLLGVNWPPPYTTCVVLIVLTAVNTVGVRIGSGVAVLLTSLKVLALLAIVALGVGLQKGDPANFATIPDTKALYLALVPVMYAILWTYDGWSDVGAIAGEVRNPQRRLPLIYFTGTVVMIAIYAAVNTVYIYMAPLAEIRALPASEQIAPLVMERLIGDAGAVAVIWVVLISTLGSTHGSILTGARISFAQARDGLLFRSLGIVSARYGTPVVSLWVQLLLSCIAALFVRTFEQLTAGFVFTMWIFYGLAAAAVFSLRCRRPAAERPYRCWGYPVVPALFILAAAGMTVLGVVESPRTTLPWLAVLCAGFPVYYIWRALVRSTPGGPAAP